MSKSIRLTTIIPQVFNQIKPGATFLSVMGYRNNFDEVSNFGLIFHFNYLNTVRKALAIWDAFIPQTPADRFAKQAMVQSYNRSLLAFRLHKNPDLYSFITDQNGKTISGVKWLNTKNEVHLYGLLVHKKVLVPGKYPPVKPKSEMEEAKDRLLEMTPLAKFRQFKLIDGRFDRICVDNLTLTQKELHY